MTFSRRIAFIAASTSLSLVMVSAEVLAASPPQPDDLTNVAAANPKVPGFAQRLLFTAEAGANGGVWQATLDVPSRVTNLQPFIGRGGFEGIQNDPDGNLWIVEDVGGATGTGANSTARRPNSYVYRFIPNDIHDLTKGGRLQALQVFDTHNAPITWGIDLTADQAAFTEGVKTLHTCGLSLNTRWITLATTDAAATAPGSDANALARAQGATPFKRPGRDRGRLI